MPQADMTGDILQRPIYFNNKNFEKQNPNQIARVLL